VGGWCRWGIGGRGQLVVDRLAGGVGVVAVVQGLAELVDLGGVVEAGRFGLQQRGAF
jgi:hypothetical protein